MNQNSLSINHGLMHKVNCSLILSSLRKHPSQTRAKLAKHTGLTRSTISNLIDELIEKNFIHEVGYEPSSGGRRGILLELNPEGGSAIAVKINASSVQCALSNLVGDILWHKLVPLTSTEVDDVLPIAEQLIREAITINSDQIEILGIAVGVTGLVSDDGVVVYSKNLDWKQVNLRAAWEQCFKLPVTVDNDVSLAAFGENHYGTATKDRHFIYVEIGYGVGAGIILDGQLYRGSTGHAGEVGYIVFNLVDADGNVQSTTWEELTNIPRLKKMVAELIDQGMPTQLQHQSLTFNNIIQAAHAGDLVAVEAMQQLTRNVGIGLANLVNIFDISTFVLGGELGTQYESYLDTINDSLRSHLISIPPDGVTVRISNLNPDAVLMGAIAQVFDEILREPSLNVNL
ncbi:MAG: ROK family transcriptional regulator [Anaerolineae bacterium]|nr:ROK family transcriptional regulator [Anaerolineae bacterium]